MITQTATKKPQTADQPFIQFISDTIERGSLNGHTPIARGAKWHDEYEALIESHQDQGMDGFNQYFASLQKEHPYLTAWLASPDTEQEAEKKQGKYRPKTLLEMLRTPRPSDIIEDIFYEKTVAELFGPAGTKKSFLAFDWLAHIAMNMPWQGHAIKKPGKCVYTVAEGADNFIKRALAWCSYHRIPIEKLSENLILVDREIPLSNSAEVSEYISDVGEFIHNVSPVVVTFDTLMRCSGGGNINAPDVMATLFDGANRIRRELDASQVLIIHHEGKDSTKGSAGSFVLRANCDIAHRLTCEAPTGTLTLSCNPSGGGKMKDKAEYPDIYLNTRAVYYTEEMTKDDSSLVIVGGDKPTPTLKLTPNRQIALDSLPQGKGLSYSEWRSTIDTALTSDSQPAMGKPTFDKCREWLSDQGLVRKDVQGLYWRIQGEE